MRFLTFYPRQSLDKQLFDSIFASIDIAHRQTKQRYEKTHLRSRTLVIQNSLL